MTTKELTRRAWRLALQGAAALGLLLIVVCTTPVLRWWTAALSTQWGNEDGDVLIVLGGDITDPNTIGFVSYLRSYYAVLEWRDHHYRKLIVTGREVAPLMRQFIVSQGVPADVVTVENSAASTHESALFLSQMLKAEPGRVVLLTSDYHMGRALRAFNRAGLHTSPVPIPDGGKRANDPVQGWTLFCGLIQETAKVFYYKARGWS